MRARQETILLALLFFAITGGDQGAVRQLLLGKEVQALLDQPATQVSEDKIESHLGGGGQWRRVSKHAHKVSPTAKRAGGSSIMKAGRSGIGIRRVSFL